MFGTVFAVVDRVGSIESQGRSSGDGRVVVANYINNVWSMRERQIWKIKPFSKERTHVK